MTPTGIQDDNASPLINRFSLCLCWIKKVFLLSSLLPRAEIYVDAAEPTRLENFSRGLAWPVGCVHFLVYLQDYIAGRSIIDAHFGRHHHHVILSDVEARWAQAVSAKQKFKKVFCITTSVPCVINCDYILVCFLALPPSWHPLIYTRTHARTHPRTHTRTQPRTSTRQVACGFAEARRARTSL